MRTQSRTPNERGIALVMALLVLLTLSLLAIVILSTVMTDTRVAGQNARSSAALNTAEAGIAEACSRIKAFDIVLNNNPRAVAQIFNCASGSVPVLGVDSTGLPTAQPAGQWLNYTSTGRGAGTLTVQYKTNSARTLIYRYNPLMNPAVQTASGLPIYVITSTGREGGATRSVVAEIIQKPINLNMHGGLASQTDVKFTGNAVSCGYNHRADTPYDTGINGRTPGVAGGCAFDNGLSPPQWELGVGNQAGVWSSSTIDPGGTGQPFGSPALNPSNGNSAFYAGPWEAVGMSQAEFWSWVGAPRSTMPANQNGIIYLDNNTTYQDRTGSWGLNAANGSGFLYVDGDLHLNSGFTWRGLIYVEGDFDLNGHAWILGGIIAKGRGQTKFNGGATILYSFDAIQENITKFGSKFTNLSWREL